MASTMKTMAVLCIVFFSMLRPVVLFSFGNKQEQSAETKIETKIVTDLQDRYNALAAPGIVMLPMNGTSAVDPGLLDQIEKELFKHLVNGGRVKPLRMQQWLLSTYTNKANNPFVIMNAIKAEQYVTPVQYIGKAAVFRSGSQYYFALYVYPLESYYPVIIFRQWASLDEVDTMISSCVDELHIRLSQSISGDTRKRVIIDNFKIEFLRLVEHSSGEFDFITAPFLESEGVTLRAGDDFFSRTMGYILAATKLFQVFQIDDFREYSNAVVGATTSLAEYRMEGRVLLSEYECMLYVNVVDIRSGARVVSLRQPLLSYSFNEVWNAYRLFSVQIIEKLFAPEIYGVIPQLVSPGRNFFANDMFVGWDTLENFILVRGAHVISTGSAFRREYSADSINSYHILLDNSGAVYADMEGEHIWKLFTK
jgi:hypothetical protein